MEQIKSVHITEMDNGFSVRFVTEHTVINMVFLTRQKMFEWLSEVLKEFGGVLGGQ